MYKRHLGITAFHHILRDKRTQNIPLILATPGFLRPKVIWSKEIEVLQALTSTPPAIKSEDLQSLVHEIESVVEELDNEAKSKHGKQKTIPSSSGGSNWVEEYLRMEDEDASDFTNDTIRRIEASAMS